MNDVQIQLDPRVPNWLNYRRIEEESNQNQVNDFEPVEKTQAQAALIPLSSWSLVTFIMNFMIYFTEWVTKLKVDLARPSELEVRLVNATDGIEVSINQH